MQRQLDFDKPKETKRQRLLRLLKQHGTVTAHDSECGKGLRIAPRIAELREDGHVIETIHRDDKVCVYRLVSECLDVDAYRAAASSRKFFAGMETAGATC